METKCFNFITLSNLMGSRSLSGLPTRQLKTRMAACVGARIDALSAAKLPQTLQTLEGHKKPLVWLQNMVQHSELLRVRGIDYLVLDTLQYTSESELNQITPLLQTLSQQGVQIVVVDQHQVPIFFASMREVICTDDFIKIYVKSLWTQSRALGPNRMGRAPEEVKKVTARPTPSFRFMERIFVA